MASLPDSAGPDGDESPFLALGPRRPSECGTWETGEGGDLLPAGSPH